MDIIEGNIRAYITPVDIMELMELIWKWPKKVGPTSIYKLRITIIIIMKTHPFQMRLVVENQNRYTHVLFISSHEPKA